MSIFAKPQAAPKLVIKEVEKLALVQAGLVVMLVVAQLFTFEDFLQIFIDMNLASDSVTYLLASMIVVGEVFSLPFLLRLKISKAMRVFSMLLLWFVSLSWLTIALLITIKDLSVESSGLLGSVVEVGPGAILVIFTMFFATLTVINSWGMWPLVKAKK